MAAVVVRTTMIELGLYRDDYDQFIAALEAADVKAELNENQTEFRGSLPPREAVEVGIWVADHLLEPAAIALAVEVIKEAAKDTISRRKRGRRRQGLRRLPIYDGRGEIIDWVELPADES